ncbi:RHOMBOID-like protein 14 [Rhynchospora pubera]|uniref:RHOMBOID-like protein 14 n=1 Tax=Rhynchospora pubera TaxID=906938 RepID=A0AAV8ECQ1_9POAL|nr:RHOMBOID-like protein 14 [Rhynchospora pubera]
MDSYGGVGWRGRVSRGMVPLLALHVANEYLRLGHIPPVTSGLILTNTLLFLRPGPLHRLLPSINRVWFNPHLIFKNRDLRRFFLSAFYHVNEPHLVYNMMSLLWKGIQLETSMGSVEFASMVASLLALSQGATLILAKSLLVFDYDSPYYSQFSVGFSGVLFALKVVLNSRPDADYSVVHGLVTPSKYAAWAELLLIQLFVPDASFLGHLGGILAGILYLRLRRSFSGPNPLTLLLGGFVKALSWPLRFLRSSRGRLSGRGRVGRGLADAGGVWRCPLCTFDNSEWLDACEMCSTARGTINNRNQFSVFEVRQRRLQRFVR